MNFELPVFENKDIVFIGKGKEWLSFEKFITSQIRVKSLKNIFINDENRQEQNEYLKSLNLEETIVVKTAGYAGRLMPVAYTTPTRIFFDCVKQSGAKSVGITGTKGKTTTSSLLAATLKNAGFDARLCGNIGLPMLDNLDSITQNTIFVVELSSFQLAELSQSPDVAIITNLFRDHTDYHGNLEEYWEAKHNIMKHMDESGTVIFNPEFEVILHWLADSPAKQLPINPEENVDMSKAKLIGDHNKLNYLMVRAAAELFGVDRMSIANTLYSFEPVRHRLQPVRTVNGVTYVDDAIGSNPEATAAGIKALIYNKGPIGCVFLGGVDRNYDYTELVKLLHTLAVPKLVLFPDTGSIIKELLPSTYEPEILETRSMEEAVNWAATHTPSGSICLLSTAAPSTVLWSSFEEKGSMFQQYVLALSETSY